MRAVVVNCSAQSVPDFHLLRTVSYNRAMNDQAARPDFDPASASDIRGEHWLLRAAPAFARPYLRLIRADRPIGTWLLLIPCLWAAALAGKAAGLETPPVLYFALFAVGSFVMRGAGCVINDLWDRDIDAKVARTATRPIASGEISVPKALIFLAMLLLIGLGILLRFNMTTIVVAISSLGLVVVYPLMKRITWWPQAILGLTFNWGALVGWTAVTGELQLPALVLYAAGFFWILGYDTLYGHQDKADDIMVGVKSSSIRLGDRTKPAVAVFYAVTLALIGWAGNAVGLGVAFYAGLAVTAAHFAWQVSTLDIDDPANCLARFKSNRDAGLIVFLGILFG